VATLKKTYTIPHIPILGIIARWVIPTRFIPVDISTSGESHRISNPEVSDYNQRFLEQDIPAGTISDPLTSTTNELSSVPLYVRTYCSGSMYTSAEVVSYASGIGRSQLTLIIDPNLSADHEIGWFLPIKRLPVVFMFRPSLSASCVCDGTYKIHS
jgi:hypothetical protein